MVSTTVFRAWQQEARAAFVADRELQVRAIENRYRANFEARVPDFGNLLFAVVDNFATHDAPGVRTRQTGGKGAVFENGVAVLAALFHDIRCTAALTADHLVITFPDVGIFGIQV